VPEGNELHRWAERHAAAFAGKVVRVDGPQGRFTDSRAIDGKRLRRVMAVGKHLGYDFGKDLILHVHLGLRGGFTEGSGPLPEVKGALRLRTWNAAAVKKPKLPQDAQRHDWYRGGDGSTSLRGEDIAWMELRGPTDCSLWTQEQWAALLDRLGPDPLNGDAGHKAFARIAKSTKPIAALLMEQDILAGVGNIYRAELLFRARLNPFMPGRDVPLPVLKKLYAEAGPLMRAGMEDRRIVTTLAKDRPHKKGRALDEEVHYVCRRTGQPCRICDTAVMKMEDFYGRNLFWCPVCQA
jgi:endonuclease-8